MDILKLTLSTADLKGTKQFYNNRLGLAVINEQETSVSFSIGNSVIQFQQSTTKALYHFAFNIPQNKMDEALQWCLAKQFQMLPFQSENLVDFPNWNAQSVYFLDNNGNILELIARRDLNNPTAEPFSVTDILCVSEIGLVVDDVLQFCSELKEKYGIPYYEKQPPAHDFSVMGDASGLFIVVPQNRKWFPTTITSAKFPLQVTIMQNETTSEFIF